MDADANRATAQAFYDLMFNQGRPREAIERYAGEMYTQHNHVYPAQSGRRSLPRLA